MSSIKYGGWLDQINVASSPSQLRHVLERSKELIKEKEIVNSFYVRVGFLIRQSDGDSNTLKALIDLRDDIEIAFETTQKIDKTKLNKSYSLVNRRKEVVLPVSPNLRILAIDFESNNLLNESICEIVRLTLQKFKEDHADTSKALGVSGRTLYKWMKKYNLLEVLH